MIGWLWFVVGCLLIVAAFTHDTRAEIVGWLVLALLAFVAGIFFGGRT